NRLLDVGDLVALASSHQNVQRLRRLTGQLIIEIDVGDIKRNVLLSVPAKRLLKFLFAHLRQNDVLDDNGVSADSSCYSRCLDLVLVKNVRDDVRHVIQFHDLAIDDRVRLQVLEAETHELEAVAL